MSHRSTNSNQTTLPPLDRVGRPARGQGIHDVHAATVHGVVGDVDAPRCLGTPVGDFDAEHVTVASGRGC